MICWKCKKELAVEKVYRSSECPFCKADLHCCKACRFYSPGNHLDCREAVLEPVADKEKSNFCDFFSIANGSENNQDSKKAAALDNFNALFGETEQKSEKKSGKAAFDALFGGIVWGL